MAMKILGNSPELILIFDRSAVWLSREQILRIGSALSNVEGVESIQTRTAWFQKPQIRVVFDATSEPNIILRKMASALRAPMHSKADSSTQTNAGLLGDLSSETPSTSSNLNSKMTRIGAVVGETPGDHRGLFQPATCRLSTKSRWSARLSSTKPQALVFRNSSDEALVEGHPVPNRLRQFGYGILTLGSFGMSCVGLIIPGIPTIPFVLFTAHFALHASPTLRERLLSSRMYGSMMREWQEHRAIRRVVQLQAYAATIAIIVIGFFFSPPFLIFYLGMSVASAMGLYAISQIPVIEYTDEGGFVIHYGDLIKQPSVVT